MTGRLVKRAWFDRRRKKGARIAEKFGRSFSARTPDRRTSRRQVVQAMIHKSGAPLLV
jgi:hypothetical protein